MEKILSIKNSTKIINSQVILDNINIDIYNGEIIGIKGHNGSGKSMLFKTITGMVLIDAGIIKLFNEDVNSNSNQCFKDIGALIEYPGFLPNMSGFKSLKLLASINNKIKKSDIIKAIREVGLDPYDKRHYKRYSLGMKQRLGIAAAIMENPKLLVLDEPFNNLDNEGKILIKNILKKHNKEKGTTILFASHDDNDFINLSSKVFEMVNGTLKEIS